MKKVAYIIVDSGFSASSLAGLTNVIGICDLEKERFVTGNPVVSREALDEFAGDRLRHGTLVLANLLQHVPASAPFVLVKAWGENGRISTGWRSGEIARRGWTEAYVWAVELARNAGYMTVANFSFGGVRHAADGTGWEAHQISRVIGAGHVPVAAAGPGDGRPVHASVRVAPGSGRTIHARQDGESWYNFWAGTTGGAPWSLEVYLDDTMVHAASSQTVPPNLWNGKRQVTFTVAGSGRISLVIKRPDGACVTDDCLERFDVWVEGNSVFTDWVDPTYIAEPACLPVVLSAGLASGHYSPDQSRPDSGPDVLLPGEGPISFRLPELVAAVGRLLEADPSLDVSGVRRLLGKYPNLHKLGR